MYVPVTPSPFVSLNGSGTHPVGSTSPSRPQVRGDEKARGNDVDATSGACTVRQTGTGATRRWTLWTGDHGTCIRKTKKSRCPVKKGLREDLG